MRLLQKILIGVLLLACLAGVYYYTQTVSNEIIIYGDSQHYPAVERQLIQQMLTFNPAAVFRVGDMVEDGNNAKDWLRFNLVSAPLLARGRYYPVMGNHERDSKLYFKTFQLFDRRRWYSVDTKGVHFIILDSNFELQPGSRQYRWLENDLRRMYHQKRYKVVLFHHPIFGVSGGHGDDEKNLGQALLPLFEKYRVSVVFNGHEHSYQRFEYQGTTFIVTGGGGSNLRDQERMSPYLKKFHKVFHFCVLSPGKDSIRIRAIDVDSNVVDDFKIYPPFSWTTE